MYYNSIGANKHSTHRVIYILKMDLRSQQSDTSGHISQLITLYSNQYLPTQPLSTSIQGSKSTRNINLMKPGNLNGLRNEGSTCYMNSLLQTLFMTNEFRQELYNYRHHGSIQDQADSIPHQLQKLFLNLQYSDDICSTKRLIKSFQWEDSQKFEQHDVQEFCRVLFDALENAADKNWIHSMYGGMMRSFVRCDNGHSSERLEGFLDLSLTIKNPFENVEHHSLDEAIKGWLKPERLQFGDKYDCQGCGKKVDATKGLEFVTLPPILTIQLKRFQLNYETMNREKINQFVYFPDLLGMEKFMKPYSEIEVQEIPNQLREMRASPMLEQRKKELEEQQKLKLKLNPEKPVLKRKNSEEKLRDKEQVSFIDDAMMGEAKKEILSANEEKQKNIETLKNIQFSKGDLDTKFQRLQQMINKKKETVPQPKQSMQDIDNDILFGIGGAMISESSNWEESKKTTQTSIQYSHAESKYNPVQEYPPDTYSLFAVLVHDGSAHHGHYYAYIKIAEQWYRFNDSKVTKVDQREIRKYGDMFKFSQGANAYMLFYRNVNTIQGLKEVEADAGLRESAVQPKETQSITKQGVARRYTPHELRSFDKPFKIRLYYPKPTLIELNKVSQMMTAEELKQYIKTELKLEEDDSNWRLRVYNSFEDTMLQPIEGDSKTLLEHNLRETVTLTVEVKLSAEVFEEYDPRLIILNVNVWRPGLFYLTEEHLKPLKIKIRDDETYDTLHHIIKERTGLENPVVIRRTFVSGGNNADVVPLSNKTLVGLRFFNNLNLYVEEKTATTKWQEEFDSEKYRITVNYNNPLTQASGEVCFDNRRTLKDLKTCLGGLIGIAYSEFRIKSSRSSGELMGKKRLIDLRMVGQASVYLELGKSIKDIINISAAKAVNTLTGVGYSKQSQQQFQIEVNRTILDLKKEIALKHSVSQDKIRVRELKEGLGQIYKSTAVLEEVRDKVLSWELGEESRGVQIYTRFYNGSSLRELEEVYVEYDGTYQQLAMIIGEHYQIDPESVYALHPVHAAESVDCLQATHWHNVNAQEGRVNEMPFYLTTDGEYLIVKEGDKRKYIPQFKSPNTLLTSTSPTDKKEKSLKITVKRYKNDDEGIARVQKNSKERVNPNEADVQM